MNAGVELETASSPLRREAVGDMWQTVGIESMGPADSRELAGRLIE